jgi:hypothetical protein
MKTKDDNPLLNFLPELMSKEEFFLKIAQVPLLDLNGSECERVLQLSILRQDLFIPLTFHFWFYQKLISIMKESYEARTPISWIKSIKDSKTIKLTSNQEVEDVTVLGFTFLGVPGMGKTTIVKRVLKTMPQVVNHVDLGIRQVTYLRVDCTVKGSTKQLCCSILNQFDRALGTDYFNQHSRESEERLVITISLKSIIHRLGCLFVDEIHNLETSNDNLRKRIMNYFKTLANTIGVPIIYIGTDQAAPILFGDFQTGSRAQGFGMPLVDRLEEDDKEWLYVINQLWKHQVLRKPGELTDELVKCYYRESQGILRRLVQVHCVVQEIALSNKSETIEPEYFDSVKGQLGGTAEIIDALATNNRNKLKNFPEVLMTKSYMYRGATKGKKTSDENSLLEFAKKKWPKLEPNQMAQCVELVLMEFKELTLTQKCEKLEEGIKNLDANGQALKKVKGNAKGDLIDVCETSSSNSDRYNLLKEAGLIRTPEELFS